MAVTPPPSASQPTPLSSASQPPTAGPLTPGWGTSGTLPPIPSNASVVQPVLGSQALVSDPSVIAGATADAQRTAATHIERVAALTGDIEKGFGRIARDIKQAADHVEATARRTRGHAEATAAPSASPFHPGSPQPHAEGTGVGTPFLPATPSTGRAVREVADPHFREALISPTGAPESSMRYQGQFSQFQSLSNIRSAAATSINRRVSEYAARRGNYTQDEHGNWFRADGRGNPIEQVPATEGQAWARSMSRIGRVEGAITSIGTGESVTGALAGMTRFAGPIGAAIAGAHFAVGQIQGQREANRYYQAIEGGSNFSGFEERGREAMFGWSQMFGMGSGRAREMFRDVTAMGLTGGERQGALDFGTHEFNAIGMDVKDSMELVRTSIHDGIRDFGLLQQAIGGVAQSAREGGMNVQEATRQFAQNYQVVSQQLRGPQSPVIAGALTGMVAAQGHTMEGINLAAGLSDPMNMRIMAARSGMSYGQFLSRSQSDPAVLGVAAGRLMQQRLNGVLGVDAQQFIRQRSMELTHGTGNVTPEIAQQVASEMYERYPQIDPDAIRQTVGALAPGANTAQAGEMAVRMTTGALNPAAALSSAAKASRTYQAAGLSPTNPSLNRVVGHSTYGGNITQRDRNIVSMWKGMGIEAEAGIAPGAINGGSSYDTQAYEDLVRKTGTRIPEIEALLKQGSDPHRRFAVQTAEGERKVTLSEAMQYFPDQLAAGTARVVKGEGEGSTVAQITGLADPTASRTPGKFGLTAASSSAKPKIGEKVDDGDKESGTVRIIPSPELAQILRISVSGGAYLQDSRLAGTSPDPFPPTYDAPSSTAGG